MGLFLLLLSQRRHCKSVLSFEKMGVLAQPDNLRRNMNCWTTPGVQKNKRLGSPDEIASNTSQQINLQPVWYKWDPPKCVTTNRGPQFESALFFKLCKCLGCERIRTTAYHPAANGMVERLNRQHKAALMSCRADHEHWVENLSIVVLGIRSSFKPSVNNCAVLKQYLSSY